MGIHENIKLALASVAVNAATGDAKVYTDGAPQDVDKPFVIFKRKMFVPVNTLNAPVGYAYSVFIFESWDKRRKDADDLADDVKTAIQASSDLPIKFELDLTEDDLKEYVPLTDEWVSPVKFGFWHAT